MRGVSGNRVRTPTRLQMEATECGAAALGSILEYHGSYVPLTELRQRCGVSRDGSKAANILRAARSYGLQAKGYRKDPEALCSMPMPVILHWNFNHFLVLEGIDSRWAYLNDPATGPRRVPRSELERAFTGVVLGFERGPEYRPGGKRPSVLGMLLRQLRGSRDGLVYLFLAGLLLVPPNLALPVFSKVFIDEVLISGKRDWLGALLLGMLLTAGLRAALGWLQQNYLLRLASKLSVTLTSGFLWHALRLPVPFYMARSHGDIASRVGLSDELADLLSGDLASVLLDVVLVGFFGGLMWYFDPVLTGLVLGVAVAHVGLLLVSARARADLNHLVSAERGKLEGVAAEGLQTIETLKASGAESDFFSRWAGHHAKVTAAEQRLARKEQWLLALSEGVTSVGSLLLLGVGASRVMDGALTIGTLVAFQSLASAFLDPLEGLTQFSMAIQELRGDVERFYDVLAHPVDAMLAGEMAGGVAGLQGAEPADAGALAGVCGAGQRLTGEVALEGVTFGYQPFAPPTVEGVWLYVAAGQRVALVGGTGSGKSTLAKLVAGIYAPSRGAVCFDGRARSELPLASLRASVAMVDQQITLFEGSLRDNLTLWDDTVPERDVVAAAKDACIHDDIMRLPGGYDAHVTEGGFNFSGGQRQRLEIARALVRHPSVLVLDEATSALDPETEKQVDENLRRRGCTCLIVAHRLSTIRDCDEILVLDRGEVVERGPHASLLEAGGLYHDLVAAG